MFSVDIEEGKPPLKLPYNVTEDPWQAAQAFLHRYDLSQLFLDQVANFIVDNAKGVTLGMQPGSYDDPFTGKMREVGWGGESLCVCDCLFMCVFVFVCDVGHVSGYLCVCLYLFVMCVGIYVCEYFL